MYTYLAIIVHMMTHFEKKITRSMRRERFHTNTDFISTDITMLACNDCIQLKHNKNITKALRNTCNNLSRTTRFTFFDIITITRNKAEQFLNTTSQHCGALQRHVPQLNVIKSVDIAVLVFVASSGPQPNRIFHNTIK